MPEYSNSQLGKFENCPLQYRLMYVDRIKRPEEGVEAFLGQRFHEAMEWLYRERAFRDVPLEELLRFYESQWKAAWHAEVKITKKERRPDDYRLLGRRFIEDYYRRHQPFVDGRACRCRLSSTRTDSWPSTRSGSRNSGPRQERCDSSGIWPLSI